MNYASVDGNKILNDGLSSYDVDRQDKCGEIQAQSAQSYSDRLKAANNLEAAFNGVSEGMETLERCIDYSTWYFEGEDENTPQNQLQIVLLLNGEEPDTFEVGPLCGAQGLDEYLPLENKVFSCK